MEQAPFQSPRVEAAYAGFPEAVRLGLLRLRDLIFEIAAETPGVGPLEETLKWGQPAFLTPETRSGSTIRVGVPKTGGFALYVHCQTTIIAESRDLFPDDLTYEGNRAIHFQDLSEVSAEPVRLVIARALTYHQRSGRRAAGRKGAT
ncbi:MAG: DUF1801 domain-containing protein [Pseudomonadota bacterium]